MIVHLLCIRKKILPFCRRTNFSRLNKCLEPEIRGQPLSSVTGAEFWKPTKTLIKPDKYFQLRKPKMTSTIEKNIKQKNILPGVSQPVPRF